MRTEYVEVMKKYPSRGSRLLGTGRSLV